MKQIPVYILCVLILLVAAACSEPGAVSQPPDGSSIVSSKLSGQIQHDDVDIQALTEEFLSYAMEEYGYNSDEPKPTATFIEQRTVDNEPWYLLSYDVSFMSDDTNLFLVSEDLERIYRILIPEDMTFGQDVWAPDRDDELDAMWETACGGAGILTDDLSKEEILLIDSYRSMFRLVTEDYGSGGSVSPFIAIVNGRTCLLTHLLYVHDFDTTLLANYALTIDGTELYRMNDDGIYETVLQRSPDHGYCLYAWVGDQLDFFPQKAVYYDAYLGEQTVYTDPDDISRLLSEVVDGLSIQNRQAVLGPANPAPENGGYRLMLYEEADDAEPGCTVSLDPCYITLNGVRHGPFEVENQDEVIERLIRFSLG